MSKANELIDQLTEGLFGSAKLKLRSREYKYRTGTVVRVPRDPYVGSGVIIKLGVGTGPNLGNPMYLVRHKVAGNAYSMYYNENELVLV